MKTFIKFRVSFSAGNAGLKNDFQPFRELGSDVVELVREFDSPVVRELFAPWDRGAPNSRWFVSCFEFDFRYSKAELDAAAWFYGRFTRSSNDYCDQERTRFDKSMECPFCGVGQVQLSPLILPNISRKPANALVSLANGNYVCRRDLAEALVAENLTGFMLIPVATSIKMANQMDVVVDPKTPVQFEPAAYRQAVNEKAIATPNSFAYQLLAPETIEISPLVWVGTTPFAKENRVDSVRCPLEHTLGHRLLSPLAITGSSNLKLDFHSTKQHVGGTGGYFRPHRQVLFSPRAAAVIARYRPKGIAIDPLICSD